MVDDRDGIRSDDDVDLGRSPGLLASVKRIVDQLLDHHQRPVLRRLAGLVDQFGDGGEIGETRRAEGLPIERVAAALARSLTPVVVYDRRRSLTCPVWLH
jgi:hypothetical protein